MISADRKISRVLPTVIVRRRPSSGESCERKSAQSCLSLQSHGVASAAQKMLDVLGVTALKLRATESSTSFSSIGQPCHTRVAKDTAPGG
jgi:hypothetical protein